MRFVPVKSEESSAVLVLHRTRDFLVRQRTQIGNAIRAHIGEFGIVVAQGTQNIGSLKDRLPEVPEAARRPLGLLFAQLAETKARIDKLAGEIEESHKKNEASRRLVTVPGVGVLTATVIAATTPDVTNFACARE